MILKKSAVARLILFATLASGCQTKHPTDAVALAPIKSMIKGWSFDLELKSRHDAVRELYLRDDVLYVCSDRNFVAALSAAGGKPIFGENVTPDQIPIKPPLVLGERVIFPAGSTLQIYDKKGKKQSERQLGHSLRSPAAGNGEMVYVGLDYPAGGRLAAVDLTRPQLRARWELLLGAVSAAPAVYEDVIYVAAETGAVTAINGSRDPMWPLDDSAFRTGGRVLADVIVDDSGVYVASTDSKLYCLDRATGKLKWQFFAGAPLEMAPVVTADTVYQYIPGVGVAALDKLTGKFSREPRWVASGARKFLAQDDKYAYLRGAANNIVALDKITGDPAFKSRRDDFEVFASNTKDATIYAARRDGLVMAIKPVLKPGTVGTMVLAPAPLNDALASR
ncbi:MAG: PQQ-binding-like beta-propeller repeat protein [Tepidisphaeraceae bacterium]